MAVLALVDAVTAELLQPAGKAPRNVLRDTQLKVFLLAHPASTVVARQRKAAFIAFIGAAVMPERAIKQHHAARRHGRGDRLDFPTIGRRRIELVAAR